MLPLKDENPTRRTPFVTVLLIGACLWAFFAWQPLDTSGTVDVETAAGILRFDESTAFVLEYAAIPCEIVQQRPLSIDEIRSTFGDGMIRPESCGAGSTASPPVFGDKSVWVALLTSMFLHGGLLHLGGNLLFLWIFGNNIEDHLGHVRYLAFYLVGGLFASFAHIALNLDSTIPVVGASGAIAAVMGAYMVWFPNAPVRTAIFFVFISIVDIRAKWLLGFWFVSQFFTNPNSGVAWAAHVGGFVFGVAIGLLVRTSANWRRALWTSDYAAIRSWDTTGGAGHNPYGSRRLGRRR